MLCAARQPLEHFLAMLIERPRITVLKQRWVQLFKAQKQHCGNARERVGHILIVGCQKLSESYLDKA